MGDRITVRWGISNYGANLSSGSFTSLEEYVPFNAAWFDSLVGVYLVVNGGISNSTGCTPNSSASAEYQLYNATDASSIGSVTLYNYPDVGRSANLLSSMPASGEKNLVLRHRVLCGTTSTLINAYLEFVIDAPANGDPVKAAILRQVGYTTSYAGGTYTEGNDTENKRLVYDSTLYGIGDGSETGISAIYFGATHKGDLSGGSYSTEVQLYDPSDLDSKSVLTQSTTTYTYQRSSDLRGLFIDGNYLTTRIKRTGTSNVVRIYNAHLIIVCDDIEKFEDELIVVNDEVSSWNRFTTNSFAVSSYHRVFYKNYDVGTSKTLYCEAVAKKNSGTDTGSNRLYNQTDAATISNTQLDFNSATITRKRQASAMTAPDDDDQIRIEGKGYTSSSSNLQTSCQRIIIQTTGVDQNTSSSHSCSMAVSSLTITPKTPSATHTQNIRSNLPVASLTLSAKTPSATLAPLSSQLPASSLTLTGQTPGATLTQHVRCSIPLATLTLTAQTPQLTLEPISSQLPAVSLSLTANAPSATLTESHTSAIPSASLDLIEQAPSFTHTLNIFSQIPNAALTLSAQTPNLTLAPLSCELPTASLSLTANAPGATKTENFSSQLPSASLTLTANNPGATTTENKSSAIPSASLTLTPNAPQNTVPNNQYASIPAASLTLSPQTPAFSLPDSSSSIPLVTLTLTANAPGATVTEHIYCAIPSAALTLTAQTPQLTLAPLTCSLPSFSLTLTPQTPQATTAGTDTVSLPVSALTLTANAPSATVTGHNWSAIPAASLTLTAQTPQLTLAPLSSQLPAVSLTLTGNAPQATVTQHIRSSIPAASISLTANTPQATITQNVSSSLPSAALTLSAKVPQTTISEFDDIITELQAATLALSALSPQVTVTQNIRSQIPIATLTLAPKTPDLSIYEPLEFIGVLASNRVFSAQSKKRILSALASERTFSAEAQNRIYGFEASQRIFESEFEI